MPEAGRSPFVLALERAWRRISVRIGCGLLAGLFLLSTYAPFLTGELALVWIDDDGVALPALASLFNQSVSPRLHDLYFNLLALLLPLAVVAWLARRKTWGTGPVLAATFAASLLALVAVVIPLVPVETSDGTDWRSLWRQRPLPTETISAWQQTAPEERAWAVFPLVPQRFDAPYPGMSLASPGTVNPATDQRLWIGADVRGHDLLVRMIYGGRVSLTIGFLATGIALMIGTLIGALSGFFGGWVDLFLQRLVELMLAFPTFILVLIVVAMTGRDIFIIMAVIGVTGWAGTARLVRGEFLAQSSREYVLACRALGLPTWRTLFLHILPNAMTPLLISATFGIAGAVLTESGLAFIGMGDSTVPSWGELLNQGRQNIEYAWLIYIPGLAVFALVTSLNLVGNGLREALDPKAGPR